MRKKAPFKHVKQAQIQGMDKAKVLLEQAAVGELPKVLAVFADECLQYIWQTWPVKSGKTISEIRVQTNGSMVSLVCLVPYSVYIHLPGERGSALFTRFIPAIENHITQLVKQTTERIAAQGTQVVERSCPPGLVALRKQQSKEERDKNYKVRNRKRKKMSDAERRARDAARKRTKRALGGE